MQPEPNSSALVLQDAIFGVLYTLSKEKMGTSWKISSFEVFIHFLQLFLIMVSNLAMARLFPYALR